MSVENIASHGGNVYGRHRRATSHLDPAQYSRALEVKHPLESVGVEMSRPGAEVVETPNDRVGDKERVVLEEEVLVVLHPVRLEDAHVAIRNGPEEVRLFSLAVFLCHFRGAVN